MRLSVVVTTYNRRELLRNTLETLFHQGIDVAEFEIVVVADGSTDGTQEMLRALQAPCCLRLISQSNAGKAAACNAGWQAAKGRVVLFLDDDLECRPGLLAAHLGAHGGDDDRVVVGRIVASAKSRPSLAHDLIDQLMRVAEERLLRSPQMRWPDDAWVFTNCSVSRSMIERVGGFDPAFYRALEDHDLGLRMWAQGARFRYAPDAVVEEIYTKSSGDMVGDEAWYGRGEVRLGRKHPSSLQHTSLARLAMADWWKRQSLRFLARHPSLARLLLGYPVAVIDRIRIRAPRVRRFGRRLLGAWMTATRLGAAVEDMGGWRPFDAVFSRRIAVLIYHHVGPTRPGTYPGLTVSADSFERHVSALARRGYSGVTPAQYVAWRRGEGMLPERALMITFDDGYSDLAVHALPILARHGFGSCVFIVTGEIAGTNSWDESGGSGTHRLLTRGQINEWQSQGVEFGGHSRTHRSLPGMHVTQLGDEVDGCRADMLQLTGRAPVAFAYPYGDHDERVTTETAKAFAIAFTVEPGLNALGTHPHRLQRTLVLPRDGGHTVTLRARFGYSPWERPLRWRASAVRPVKRFIRRLRGAPADSAQETQ